MIRGRSIVKPYSHWQRNTNAAWSCAASSLESPESPEEGAAAPDAEADFFFLLLLLAARALFLRALPPDVLPADALPATGGSSTSISAAAKSVATGATAWYSVLTDARVHVRIAQLLN